VTTALSVRDLALAYGRRLVMSEVTFDLAASRCLGVLGANGAGKTTLLRSLVGALSPAAGEIRIDGLLPRDALTRTAVAYFAGEVTLPGFVRASRWGALGTGDTVTSDRRRLRALSRGTRQLVGLRTVLGRHPLGLIVLDEPWEGLDIDGARWLTSTLEMKRDRGAAVVISSHRAEEVAGLCDAYLLLLRHQVVLMQSQDIAPFGAVTPELLTQVLEDLRRPSPRRVVLDPSACA
jgi:iron complex transport system ATP-binding protein